MSVGQAYAAYYRDHMTAEEKRRQEEENRQRKLKTFSVVLVGNTFIGIQSLKVRFTCRDFGYDPYESTTLRYVEFTRQVLVDDTPWLVTSPYLSRGYQYDEYWDDSDYYKRLRVFGSTVPHGLMLVYDITNKETFIDMKDKFFPWIKQFLEDSKWSLFPIIVVGTKCDLLDKRQVSYDMARKFADKHNLVVFETSAKEDINVELAFMTLVAMMKERRENGTDQVEQNLTKKLDKKTKCSLQ